MLILLFRSHAQALSRAPMIDIHYSIPRNRSFKTEWKIAYVPRTPLSKLIKQQEVNFL